MTFHENVFKNIHCKMFAISTDLNMSSDLCLSEEFVSDNDFILHYDLIQ